MIGGNSTGAPPLHGDISTVRPRGGLFSPLRGTAVLALLLISASAVAVRPVAKPSKGKLEDRGQGIFDPAELFFLEAFVQKRLPVHLRRIVERE